MFELAQVATPVGQKTQAVPLLYYPDEQVKVV